MAQRRARGPPAEPAVAGDPSDAGREQAGAAGERALGPRERGRTASLPSARAGSRCPPTETSTRRSTPGRARDGYLRGDQAAHRVADQRRPLHAQLAEQRIQRSPRSGPSRSARRASANGRSRGGRSRSRDGARDSVPICSSQLGQRAGQTVDEHDRGPEPSSTVFTALPRHGHPALMGAPVDVQPGRAARRARRRRLAGAGSGDRSLVQACALIAANLLLRGSARAAPGGAGRPGRRAAANSLAMERRRATRTRS